MPPTSAHAHADAALEPGGWRRLAFRIALVGAAYLAGVHLAAGLGEAPEGAGADAPVGPSCVGCHHGGDDEPGPDAGPAPAFAAPSLMEGAR